MAKKHELIPNKNTKESVRAADDPLAIQARARVEKAIDSIPPEDLVAAIKRAPSLRGMILGYIAELMFEKHLTEVYPFEAQHIEAHDDHDRKSNKSDRTVLFNEKRHGIQLKSIQTNSIKRSDAGGLQAVAQNDGSDRRRVKFPNGTSVETTCYRRGDYAILAVPLFPFTGKWEFAYKRNEDCRPSTHKKYTAYQRKYLLATTEKITWPLSDEWTTDLVSLLGKGVDLPLQLSDTLAEPGGEIRIVQTPPMVLPLKNKKI